MIEVKHLTKLYSGSPAVNNISFHVAKGEVTGFLGPNGAGKSTTMRILASYLPPTSGSVRVAGYDVFRESLQAREQIGYMPENVPLYPEMRVREYLKYRAALKGVKGRKIRDRLSDVADLCGLNEVTAKLIGSLSKGFRQRVGLADAMIHEPELLILDEPTIGLDPNQIRQVRELIRNLSRHHTILLSSHILPEVEATCSRVIILNRGKIAAVDTPAELRKRLSRSTRVRLEAKVSDIPSSIRQLESLPEVDHVEPEELETGWTLFLLEIRAGFETDPRPGLFSFCAKNHWEVRDLSRTAASLEDVFTEITASEEP